MVWLNKGVAKKVFFAVVIMLSMMFGALIHVYAGSSSDVQSSEQASVQTQTAAVSVSTASVKNAAATSTAITVDVCPGDTLLEIANAHLPKGENVHSYMNKIKKANGLKNSDLRAGQILVLP